jgi:capsular exopolysaccharide synthesis family protein
MLSCGPALRGRSHWYRGPVLDLGDYSRVLRRNWIWVAALTLAALLAAGAASFLVKPTYTANTQLFVAIQGSGTVSELQQGNSFSQARVQSYVQTVATPVVLQPAIDSLGLKVSPQELAKRVKATTEINTVLIGITVSDESPVAAAATASAIANSLVKAVDSLEKPRNGSGASPVSLSIITPAQAPAEPSAPNTRMNLLTGLLIGLALGACVAILRGIVDDQIRGDADIRLVTQAPMLGGISFDNDARKKPLLTQTGAQSPRAESFRQLRTNLQFANITGHAKTVLLTSSLPGEGKSTTATNLSIALAQAGQSVCLVDADLRRPMVNEYLGLDRTVGLTTALLGKAAVDDLLQPWGNDNLYVLTSGVVPPNPSELLGSQEMKALIDHLESVFDTVIIDAPPLLPVTDAAVLSQHVGGIVVVVGCQTVRRRDLEKAMGALKLVGANVLGVVLNRAPVKGPDAYAYSYYGSDVEPKLKSSARGRSRRPLPESDVHAPVRDFEELVLTTSSRPASTFPGQATDSRSYEGD